MPDGNGDYSWEKHLAEHQRIWETLCGLVEHAESKDRRIELLRASQLETNESMQSLVAAIRELIHRIPPENLR
jgi:hypothetical protein